MMAVENVKVEELEMTDKSPKVEAASSPEASPASPPGGGNNAPKYGTVIPNRIFVGGISPYTTEADLTALFSNYGKVVNTKIISDRAGVSKGYGFVTFETEEEAKRLQKDSENIVLKERRLNIAPAIKKQGFGRLDTANGVAPSQMYHSNGVTYTYHNGMAFFSTSPQPMTSVCPPTPVESPIFSCGGYSGGGSNMMSPAGTFSPPTLYTSPPMLFYQSPHQYPPSQYQIPIENCWEGEAEMAYGQPPPGHHYQCLPLHESPLQLQYQPAPAHRHIVDIPKFPYFPNTSVVRRFQNNRRFNQRRPLQGRGGARGGNNQGHRGGRSMTPLLESPLTPPMTPRCAAHETTSPNVQLTHSMQALSI